MVALIREYAHEQPMYGYRIIMAMLKHDDFSINRKRVYRIWRQEELQLPHRKVVKRRFGNSTGNLRRTSPLMKSGRTIFWKHGPNVAENCGR